MFASVLCVLTASSRENMGIIRMKGWFSGKEDMSDSALCYPVTVR